MNKTVRTALVIALILCAMSVGMAIQDRSHCECGHHATNEQHETAVHVQKIKDDLTRDYAVYRKFMDSQKEDERGE